MFIVRDRLQFSLQILSEFMQTSIQNEQLKQSKK